MNFPKRNADKVDVDVVRDFRLNVNKNQVKKKNADAAEEPARQAQICFRFAVSRRCHPPLRFYFLLRFSFTFTFYLNFVQKLRGPMAFTNRNRQIQNRHSHVDVVVEVDVEVNVDVAVAHSFR